MAAAAAVRPRPASAKPPPVDGVESPPVAPTAPGLGDGLGAPDVPVVSVPVVPVVPVVPAVAVVPVVPVVEVVVPVVPPPPTDRWWAQVSASVASVMP